LIELPKRKLGIEGSHSLIFDPGGIAREHILWRYRKRNKQTSRSTDGVEGTTHSEKSYMRSYCSHWIFIIDNIITEEIIFSKKLHNQPNCGSNPYKSVPTQQKFQYEKQHT
jgi:hypothetical protein